MKNPYTKAQFVTSAPRLSRCPPDQGVEIAFAGRSNAGKSSALNTLTQQKTLARTSKTPGRTQLINFFRLDDQRRLVDLPGYGFAKVPEAVKREWQRNLTQYLNRRQSLAGLIVLMDARHPLTEHDEQMLNLAEAAGLKIHILLTKADKLKKSQAERTLQAVSEALAAGELDASVQLFSATKRQGLEELIRVLNDWTGQ